MCEFTFRGCVTAQTLCKVLARPGVAPVCEVERHPALRFCVCACLGGRLFFYSDSVHSEGGTLSDDSANLQASWFDSESGFELKGVEDCISFFVGTRYKGAGTHGAGT